MGVEPREQGRFLENPHALPTRGHDRASRPQSTCRFRLAPGRHNVQQVDLPHRLGPTRQTNSTFDHLERDVIEGVHARAPEPKRLATCCPRV